MDQQPLNTKKPQEKKRAPQQSQSSPQSSVREEPLLALQRLAGNRAVSGLIASGRRPRTVQRSLFDQVFGSNKKEGETPEPVTTGSGGSTQTATLVEGTTPEGTGPTVDTPKGEGTTPTGTTPTVDTPKGEGTTPTGTTPTVDTPKVEGTTPTGTTPTVDTAKVEDTAPKLTAPTLLESVITALASPTQLGSVKPLYAGTSVAERAVLWKSDALMTKAKSSLSSGDWLRFMADLGVYREGGTVQHASAKTADEKIREKFGAFVGDAVANGKSVVGQVVVLDGEDWFKAYYHEFPSELPRGGPTDDEPQTNAFTTTSPPKDVIVLNKNKGNAGTTIHEGMHLYQHDDSMKLGSEFYEGLTEWLTRELTTPMNIQRSNYGDNYDAVVPLVNLVGAEVIEKAYFKGDIAGLKEKLIVHWKSKTMFKWTAAGKWKKLLKAFKAEKWNTVKDLLK